MRTTSSHSKVFAIDSKWSHIFAGIVAVQSPSLSASHDFPLRAEIRISFSRTRNIVATSWPSVRSLTHGDFISYWLSGAAERASFSVSSCPSYPEWAQLLESRWRPGPPRYRRSRASQERSFPHAACRDSRAWRGPSSPCRERLRFRFRLCPSAEVPLDR